MKDYCGLLVYVINQNTEVLKCDILGFAIMKYDQKRVTYTSHIHPITQNVFCFPASYIMTVRCIVKKQTIGKEINDHLLFNQRNVSPSLYNWSNENPAVSVPQPFALPDCCVSHTAYLSQVMSRVKLLFVKLLQSAYFSYFLVQVYK